MTEIQINKECKRIIDWFKNNQGKASTFRLTSAFNSHDENWIKRNYQGPWDGQWDVKVPIGDEMGNGITYTFETIKIEPFVIYECYFQLWLSLYCNAEIDQITENTLVFQQLYDFQIDCDGGNNLTLRSFGDTGDIVLYKEYRFELKISTQ